MATNILYTKADYLTLVRFLRSVNTIRMHFPDFYVRSRKPLQTSLLILTQPFLKSCVRNGIGYTEVLDLHGRIALELTNQELFLQWI